MPKYRVIVEGRNFLIDMDGKPRRCGFFQTVFVESADARHAELDAIAHVKNSEDLEELTHNRGDDPPMLHMSQVDQLIDTAEIPSPRGRTYYRDKAWWQFWR